jgi:hypothetical protein
MFKLLVLIGAVSVTGCNYVNQPDASKYYNKASDIIEKCGDRKEANKNIMAGLTLIDSKQKANILLTEVEAEAIARWSSLSWDKCDEPPEPEYVFDNKGNLIGEKE